MKRLALVAVFVMMGVSHAAIEERPKMPVVFVGEAKHRTLSDELTYPARITPKINAVILAEADGVISRITAPLGTAVKRRQRLMSIVNTDPVYQYAPSPVLSPVAGKVSNIEVTEGSRVVRGQRIATVTDPKTLHIVIEIAAQDLSAFRLGLVGELRVPSVEKTVPVRVLGVSPVVDPATGTATCELELTDAAAVKTLPLGAVGQVGFHVNARQGYSVPESAIVYRGKETFLRLVRDGKAKQIPVALGKKHRGTIEILKGLTDGDLVVERASSFVADGESVEVQKGATAAEGAVQ